jgi:DNA-binding transcriptional ArsR family regulator
MVRGLTTPRLNAVGDVVLTDPEAMRALANPFRLALLDGLRRVGTVDPHGLASRLDVAPATVQEALEELEKVGLVTRDEESRWSAVGKGFVFEIPGDAEGQGAARELSNAMYLHYVDVPRRWVADDEPRLDVEWARASGLLNARVSMTPDELRGLQEGLERLLEPFITRDPRRGPGDAAPVRILSYFMPEPGPARR